MADTIRLVSGDALPTVTLTITDDITGDPFDLSDVGTSVSINFRPAGSTTLTGTIDCNILDGANGIISFDFSGGILVDLTAGLYEGEVVIDFAGNTQTLYEPLKFRVRDEFA